MYITCVILCLFSALWRGVGALPISIIIIIYYYYPNWNEMLLMGVVKRDSYSDFILVTKRFQGVHKIQQKSKGAISETLNFL